MRGLGYKAGKETLVGEEEARQKRAADKLPNSPAAYASLRLCRPLSITWYEVKKSRDSINLYSLLTF